MPITQKEFNSSEVTSAAYELLKILIECPRYNVNEIMEYAKELREREGDTEDVDYEIETSSEEEEEESESESEEELKEDSD